MAARALALLLLAPAGARALVAAPGQACSSFPSAARQLSLSKDDHPLEHKLDMDRVEHAVTQFVCCLERQFGANRSTWPGEFEPEWTHTAEGKYLNEADFLEKVSKVGCLSDHSHNFVLAYVNPSKDGKISYDRFKRKLYTNGQGEVQFSCKAGCRKELQAAIKHHEVHRHVCRGHGTFGSVVSLPRRQGRAPRVCWEGPAEYIKQVLHAKQSGVEQADWPKSPPTPRDTRFGAEPPTKEDRDWSFQPCRCSARGFAHPFDDPHDKPQDGDHCFPHAKKYLEHGAEHWFTSETNRAVTDYLQYAKYGRTTGYGVWGCTCEVGFRCVPVHPEEHDGAEMLCERQNHQKENRTHHFCQNHLAKLGLDELQKHLEQVNVKARASGCPPVDGNDWRMMGQGCEGSK